MGQPEKRGEIFLGPEGAMRPPTPPSGTSRYPGDLPRTDLPPGATVREMKEGETQWN